MKRPKSLRRRKFLELAATAAAAGPVSCSRLRSPWLFFTPSQAETLNAVCEQIIPTDEDPGAAWAGVVKFIDRQMTRRFREFQETYRLGIEGVDQTSAALFATRFIDLPADRQSAVLRALESGKAPGDAWTRTAPKQFLDLVVSHTMQGFYGSPRHGGNRDACSWKMLGVPVVPVRGRDAGPGESGKPA